MKVYPIKFLTIFTIEIVAALITYFSLCITSRIGLKYIMMTAWSWPFALLALGIIALILSKINSTRIGDTEISGCNSWGKRLKINFDEIGSVQSINFGLVKFVKLIRKNGAPPVWLTESHQNQGEFENDITEKAGPNNPFSQYINRKRSP